VKALPVVEDLDVFEDGDAEVGAGRPPLAVEGPPLGRRFF
jgi:hypothetical protein